MHNAKFTMHNWAARGSPFETGGALRLKLY